MKIRVFNKEERKELEVVKSKISSTVKHLSTYAEGVERLEKVLRKKFTPEKMEQYITDLCEATDVKVTRDGGEIYTPNWEARKNGLDRVLDLLKYKRKEAVVNTDVQPTKIVFQILNQGVPAKETKVMEVKETSS